MDKTIFREKSVERISSPEKLDAYLKVTSPSVWVLLCAIIALLVGIICWGIVGEIETSEPTSCYLDNGDLVCYTTEEVAKKINDDAYIRIDQDTTNRKYKVKSINYLGKITSGDESFAHIINAQINDYVYELRVDSDYTSNFNVIYGKIVLETISPIKFVFN